MQISGVGVAARQEVKEKGVHVSVAEEEKPEAALAWGFSQDDVGGWSVARAGWWWGWGQLAVDVEEVAEDFGGFLADFYLGCRKPAADEGSDERREHAEHGDVLRVDGGFVDDGQGEEVCGGCRGLEGLDQLIGSGEL